MARGAAQRIADIQVKMGDAIARVGDIALSTREQRSATTSMAQLSEQINVRVQSEDEAIQEARSTLLALAGNAERTQGLLGKFHV